MRDEPTAADTTDLFDRGYKNLLTGDWREAVECFTRVINMRPDVPAFRYRAKALAELGRRTDALNDLDSAVRRKPQDPQLYAERANLLFQQQAFDAAAQDCDKALSLDPGLISVQGLRAECHAARGASDLAMVDFAEAIENDPDNAAGYLLSRAKLHQEHENLDDCLADIELAIEKNPRLAEAYVMRGSLLQQQGQWLEADDDFNRALEQVPTSVMARYGRAFSRMQLKSYQEAVADCDYLIQTATQKDAYLAKVYELRGNCLMQLGNGVMAEVDFNEAIRLNPQETSAYTLRANMHYSRGEYPMALRDYLESLKRKPRSAFLFNQMAWIWATAPDPDVRNSRRAIECATRACELTEWQEPDFLDTLAAAYANAGEFELAISWQHKAADRASEDRHDLFEERLKLYEEGRPYRTEINGPV